MAGCLALRLALAPQGALDCRCKRVLVASLQAEGNPMHNECSCKGENDAQPMTGQNKGWWECTEASQAIICEQQRMAFKFTVKEKIAGLAFQSVLQEHQLVEVVF